MTFKEKIDMILITNTLNIGSVSGLEDFVSAGRGSINDFYNENREPGRKTLKKIKSLPGLNWEWYEAGKGDVFTKNSTPAIKGDEATVNEPVEGYEIKNPNREIEILLRSLDRIGDSHDYYLNRVRQLEEKLKGLGLDPGTV